MLYIRRIIAASRGCLITKHSIQVSRELQERNLGQGLYIASWWWAISLNGTQYGMTFFRNCWKWPSELRARTKRLHYRLRLSFCYPGSNEKSNGIAEKTTKSKNKCLRVTQLLEMFRNRSFFLSVLLVNNCIDFWRWLDHISAGYERTRQPACAVMSFLIKNEIPPEGEKKKVWW